MDKETILKLIEAFHSTPCLWDGTNPDYKNRELKKEAWKTLSETFQVPVHELERKMTNLRSQFRREYKKLNHLRHNGSNKKCLWFAYEPLQFLLQDVDQTEIWDFEVKQEGTEDASYSPYLINDESTDWDENGMITPSPKPPASKRRFVDSIPSINVHNSQEDEFDAFGHLVSISLKKLPIPLALSAQTELLAVLTKYRMSAFKQEHGQ